MQLILLERVEGLGNVGDEVTVRPGYGRNYLVPKGKATQATEGNRRVFERRRAVLEQKQQEALALAKVEAGKLEGLSLEVVRATSDSKHLYGSVGSTEIAALLSDNGFAVERRNILLDQPIKEVGEHSFRVRLHPDVTAEVAIQVKSEQH
ncbi:50S ribosomal protein L9 [Mariprofundus erugo]|uniref:Large ribosomal subunit protein bL9 n=1 Tax=Mariprofundus erugo TaxID=2528639 RepID=A0A5R9H046_9PROT|nr:50S ribosomal protein L9 [Mariprofundus erugo]TLS69242.1 50S ribosomal protein L9 [Mariprofundus erugo]TLS75324.1 50S ribosomal protein L9 [Mariprofundus erugo]